MSCWPWSHHWKEWEEIERGQLNGRLMLEPDSQPIKLGTYIVQQRDCLLCGKRQLRTEKTQ